MKLKNNKKQYPKVIVKGEPFTSSAYQTYGKIWEAPKLYAWVKENNFAEFDMPLACLDITAEPFQIRNLKEFLEDCKRVEECNLKYPILLDPDGYICDGWHRVCKAILKGDTTIRAIKLESFPEPSRYVEEVK